MKNFNLSKRQFTELQALQLERGITNTQGQLYHLPNDMNEAKMLFKRIVIADDGYFCNKIETILALMEQARENAFPQLVYPTGFVTIDSNIEGFAMPFIEGRNLKLILRDPTVPFEQKKNYLIQIGMLLEQMRNYRLTGKYKDFYLNDIHEGNFIVENGTNQVKYVDLDSAVIAGLTPDRAMYLKPLAKFKNLEEKYPIMTESYYGHYIKPSDDTEIYSYMNMILSFIAQDNVFLLPQEQFLDYIYYLEDIGYPEELMQAFERLYSNDPNINPMNEIQKIRDLSRGPYNVYIRTLIL